VRPDFVRARAAGVRLLTTLALATALPLAPGTPAAELTPQQQVEGRLMCYCGCSDLTVRVCTCGTADSIRQEIAGRLANGETADQVVAAFVAKHGEQIRSAPTTSGFDLVAWVTPFLVLLLAGSGLVVVVRRWGSLRPAGTAPGAASAETPRAATDAERKALERVRREIRERR
jgi:cytochrome c-type biogenesis protein CcmH